MLFLEINGGMENKHEKEADEFAANFLIPKEKAKILCNLPLTSSAVEAFADEIGVAPGIVVGRMQHEGYLPMSHLNGLKVRYRWKTEQS